jgi:hypothetical protein
VRREGSPADRDLDAVEAACDVHSCGALSIEDNVELLRPPVKDKTALQTIEVEAHEAEGCLDILEECFEHFYVGPAAARARKAARNARLAAAGKPASK